MTLPDGTTMPPGWYPDPDGAPGLVRWWNGISWSDVATPAGPGVAVQQPVGYTPRPFQPAVPPPAPPSSSGGRTGWIIGLGVLGLVLVVLIGFLVATSGEEDVVADPPVTVPSSPPAGPTFPPGTVRIIDEAAGISYPFLGSGWYEWDLGEQYEITAIAGQYFTTQEVVPDGGIFIAQCTSGPLAGQFGYSGAGSLASTVAAVAESAIGNYYPYPNEREVRRDEERTVDGHPAHLYEFQLTWDVSGYDASGERAAMLLIDVGRAAPALLYISIPNTHAELYGVIDQVLDDVEVLE
jgi:Protein of unknown function (DUF2510)